MSIVSYLSQGRYLTGGAALSWAGVLSPNSGFRVRGHMGRGHTSESSVRFWDSTETIECIASGTAPISAARKWKKMVATAAIPPQEITRVLRMLERPEDGATTLSPLEPL